MKIDSGKRTKAENIFHIAACALVLEFTQGHLAWKVTDLERQSKFSRSLIYRYFGSTKLSIQQNAIQIFINHFFDLNQVNSAATLSAYILNAKKNIVEYPGVSCLLTQRTTTDAFLSKNLLEAVERLRLKISALFPHFSFEQVLAAQISIHGLITDPFLSMEETDKVCAVFIDKLIFG